MAAYNQEKYISEAIESVLASTFEDFELIIVDDCSKDNTLEIAKKYELMDSRIRVYVNEENLGDYPNRNKAASYANGKYIKYIDGDDMIYPWGLEIIMKNFELFPESGYCLDSIAQDPMSKFPIELMPQQAYEREYFYDSIFNKSPTSATIKLEVFQKNGGFSGLRYVGDFELWHKLSLSERVILLPHGIIWSREHEEQESKLVRSDSFNLFQYMLISHRFLNLKDTPLSINLKEVALNKILKSMARSIFRSLFLEFDLLNAKKKKKSINISFFQVLYFSFLKK